MVSIAVNDTDFMSSMPPKLTSKSPAADALTHAIEAALSKNANPLTDKDAYWAMQDAELRPGPQRSDEAARTMMAYAEMWQAWLFPNAGLGMVHAMAHALGGHYNLPHGVCNAALPPPRAGSSQQPQPGVPGAVHDHCRCHGPQGTFTRTLPHRQ